MLTPSPNRATSPPNHCHDVRYSSRKIDAEISPTTGISRLSGAIFRTGCVCSSRPHVTKPIMVDMNTRYPTEITPTMDTLAKLLEISSGPSSHQDNIRKGMGGISELHTTSDNMSVLPATLMMMFPLAQLSAASKVSMNPMNGMEPGRPEV